MLSNVAGRMVLIWIDPSPILDLLPNCFGSPGNLMMIMIMNMIHLTTEAPIMIFMLEKGFSQRCASKGFILIVGRTNWNRGFDFPLTVL